MNSRFPSPLFAAMVSLLSVAAACGPGSTTGGGGSADGGGGSGANGGSTTTDGGSSDGGNTQTSMSQFMQGPGGGPPMGCDSGPNDDADMDGYTGATGDCNDCDPNSNPSAIEVIGEAEDGEEYVPVDEDCDEIADNVAAPCDDTLALDTSNPIEVAKALELCKVAASPQDWGLVDAKFVYAHGATKSSDIQNGVLETFGTNVMPRGGSRLLALSSGAARVPGQTGACGDASCRHGANNTGRLGTAPNGYPQNAPGCAIEEEIFDDTGFEVRLRAPSNATGYSFDFRFYTFEYAEWVCTLFNDQFMAYVTPAPAGAINSNISFGSNGAPVSVNIAFFNVCEGCQNWAEWCEDPFLGSPNCPAAPSNCCPDGAGELAGTGFDIWSDPNDGGNDDGNAGGTAWLQTTAPIAGGDEFSIRFAIWDTGDGSLDATSLVDNFKWIASGGTVVVGTDPAPPQ